MPFFACRYDLTSELRTQTDKLEPYTQERMVLDPSQEQQHQNVNKTTLEFRALLAAVGAPLHGTKSLVFFLPGILGLSCQ